MIVFLQDDPLQRWYPFMNAGGPQVSSLLANTATLAKTFGTFDRETCMCNTILENFYGPTRYGWFPLMKWYYTNLLGNDWYRQPDTMSLANASHCTRIMRSGRRRVASACALPRT